MTSASLSQSKMTDRSDRVFRDACDKVLENCSFTLQSKVEQHPAVTSLLGGTTFSLCYPRDSGYISSFLGLPGKSINFFFHV